MDFLKVPIKLVYLKRRVPDLNLTLEMNCTWHIHDTDLTISISMCLLLTEYNKHYIRTITINGDGNFVFRNRGRSRQNGNERNTYRKRYLVRLVVTTPVALGKLSFYRHPLNACVRSTILKGVRGCLVAKCRNGLWNVLFVPTTGPFNHSLCLIYFNWFRISSSSSMSVVCRWGFCLR